MLLGELDLDSAPAIGALGKLDSKFEGSTEFLHEFGGKMIELAAEFFALEKIMEGFEGALEFTAQMEKMSKNTGESVEDLIILGAAFKNAHIDAGEMETLLQKMQNTLGGVTSETGAAANAFAALKINEKQFSALPVLEQFERLQKGFAGLDQASKVQAARGLFGKSGGQMLGLLGDPEAFTRAQAQAGALASLTEENAEAIDKFEVAINGAKIGVMTFFEGALAKIAPEAGDIADKLAAIPWASMGENVGETIGVLAKFVEQLFEVAKGINDIMNAVGDLFGTQAPAFSAPTRRHEKEGSEPAFTAGPASALQKMGLDAGAGYGGGDPLLNENRRQTNELQRHTALLQQLVTHRIEGAPMQVPV